MQRTQHIVLRIGLSKLTEWCLEVVGHHGQVVVGGAQCALRLVQRDARRALRIGTTVVHIVAQQVGTTAQLDQRHRIGILGIDIGTTMVGRSHSATQLARKVRILLVALVDLLLLLTQQVGTNSRRRAELLEVESLIVVACCLFRRLVPETIGIVAIEGQHLAKGYGSTQFGPSCTGVERQVETYLEGYLLEGHQVFATTTVLVVELGSHHGTAIFPLQALYLGEDLAVEFLGKTEEDTVLFAQLAALLEHPVGDTAVAHLAVTERTQAKHHRHLFLFAYLQESAQVTLTVPTEDTLLLFDMVPEDIGGNDGHPTLLHLPDLCLPLVLRQSRIVYLTHHGAYPAPVDDQTILVPRHRLTEVGSHYCQRHDYHDCCYKQFFHHSVKLV